jgi:hypothetical protein
MAENREEFLKLKLRTEIPVVCKTGRQHFETD